MPALELERELAILSANVYGNSGDYILPRNVLPKRSTFTVLSVPPVT